MKSFPGHISMMGVTDGEESANTPETQHEQLTGRHPLAQELQQALARPETTDIAAYARLVEQMLGELSMIKGHVAEFIHRRERMHAYLHERSTKLTMSDDEADRIVECLAGMRLTSTPKEH